MELTDTCESTHRWTGIYEARFAGRFLYIYVTELVYHPIPLKAFASRDEAELFANEIRQRVESARRAHT